MHDSGYWIVLSVGWDRSRPKGRRWDALVVSVEPTDELGAPDPEALAAARPERLIAWGIWSHWTGWTLVGNRGPERLRERFASVGVSEQGPFKAACQLGISAAMRLSLGFTPQDRDPFPSPSGN
jgi:hypothetical protein